MRRVVAFAFGAGAVAGIGVAILSGMGRLGNAATVELTPAQQHVVERINRQVNHELPRYRPDGIGNCLQVARAKIEALVQAGIPADGISLRIVKSPPAWRGAPRHALVDVDATVSGRPWRVALDMNSPWTLDAKQEAQFGYRPDVVVLSDLN